MSQFGTSWRRRDVLRAGAMATAAWVTPVRLWGGTTAHLRHASPRGVRRIMSYDYGLADSDAMRTLALRAVEAAKGAGATYADARITRTVTQSYVGAGLLSDSESLGIGVRALVNGAWGFAASPYWTVDEAATLARAAVAQAATNAKASAHAVDLGTYPVASGSWSTPIRIDPFQISSEEKIDFVRSFEDSTATYTPYGRQYSAGMISMGFYRQERAIATTEGAYFTQVVHRSGGDFTLTAQNTDWRRPDSAPMVAQAMGTGVSEAGAGWERMVDAQLYDQVPHLIEQAEAQLATPHKAVQVGRYDLVCGAGTMASLVAATLGSATELDRVLGYEANATGTSYLGPDPLAQLGKTTLGTSLLTVTGDRSMDGGLATVKWDDEGVEPDTIPIVTQGVLTDYQTTREQAAWLTPWYTAQHRPVRSHGCAGSASALAFPMECTPNLTLAPGAHDIDLDALIADTKRGLLFDGGISTDYQSRSGYGIGTFREIVNGKLGAIVDSAAVVFDSSQIWKGLKAIGGPSSQARVAAAGAKGQPAQRYAYTVSAVPALLTNAAIIDLKRQQ